MPKVERLKLNPDEDCASVPRQTKNGRLEPRATGTARNQSMNKLLALLVLTLLTAPAQAQDTTHGKAVFDKWCAPCHGDGPGKPGTNALHALYKGAKPALIEQRLDLPAELTKQFVRTGVSVMPFFRKTEISDAELDALAAYLAPSAPRHAARKP